MKSYRYHIADIRILCLLIAAMTLLCACGAKAPEPTVPDATESATEAAGIAPITAIDHCVVEPDERAAMRDGEPEQYRALMDAMLDHADRVTLDVAEERMPFLLELLHESPYDFFLSDLQVAGTNVAFTYAYSAEEQSRILRFMDSRLLAVANEDAAPTDNELDVILKIYRSVCRRITYDTDREDNKELGSPLFDYPADEVYKALRDGKALCYGFAYVLRCALLQRGIDAFCVYGECRAHDIGHEWVVFRYDGQYFCCDPAWDRASAGECKLLHFGKTDDERIADTLVAREFAEYHEAGYPAVACTDERFGIFRNIVSYEWREGHLYTMTDRDEEGFIFDSERFTLTPIRQND